MGTGLPQSAHIGAAGATGGTITAMTATEHAVPRFARDGQRNLAALAIAAVVATASVLIFSVFTPVHFTVDVVALTAFVFWIAYSIGFLALTQLTFGRIGGPTLRSWLLATRHRHRPLPSLAVQWSILALAAVALVLILPGLLDSVLANALSFAVVVSAWLVTVTAYAVQYARLNSEEVAIELPGSQADGPVFTDYYYLSAQIATTFSSADVNILTTRARSVVTGQTYIAFAFSTFIIALLISVLFLQN